MKERPILFSAPMVRALLDGSKTQTRRVVKVQPPVRGDLRVLARHRTADGAFIDYMWWPFSESDGGGKAFTCPYGQPGDHLWVRETFAASAHGATAAVMYRADSHVRPGLGDFEGESWKPSIHMPRAASRILLEVVSVRVEQLQDCNKQDAIAEGIHRYEHFWRDAEFPLDDVAYEPVKGWPTRYSCPVQAYQALWESINGAGSWGANPWVWVVEFKRVAP